jgi:hypothetical protein
MRKTVFICETYISFAVVHTVYYMTEFWSANARQSQLDFLYYKMKLSLEQLLVKACQIVYENKLKNASVSSN